MKKTILTILLCGVMVLGITGCNDSSKSVDDSHTFKGTILECNQKSMIVRPNDGEDEVKSSDKFAIEYVNGFNSCNVDDIVKITYIGGINESYPAQVGTTNIEIINNLDFYVTKPEQHYNDVRFNDYYTADNRTIYLAGNLEEFYIKNSDKDMTLKTYLSTEYQTFEDGIKSITNELELTGTLKDGGTKIYKSKDKDITMIVCNTLKNDKNIFIGDYSMEYIEGDCKN